jgi:hypothetical protein
MGIELTLETWDSMGHPGFPSQRSAVGAPHDIVGFVV